MLGSPNTYIAVVDDDDGVGQSMSRLLRAERLQAITYSSAEAFLADESHPRFDCLLLDVQLKGISGLELHRRLLSVNRGTPVIFITAHDNPELRSQAEALGCAGYFRKTDPGAEILAAIRAAIARPLPAVASPDPPRTSPRLPTP